MNNCNYCCKTNSNSLKERMSPTATCKKNTLNKNMNPIVPWIEQNNMKKEKYFLGTTTS